MKFVGERMGKKWGSVNRGIRNPKGVLDVLCFLARLNQVLLCKTGEPGTTPRGLRLKMCPVNIDWIGKKMIHLKKCFKCKLKGRLLVFHRLTIVMFLKYTH